MIILNMENRKNREIEKKNKDDEKRKPAFNHPDHAGLISTSIVTSLQNKLPKWFILFHPTASYPFSVFLTYPCAVRQ